MSARLLRLPAAVLFVVPLLAAPLRAQGVEYAAGVTRYRLLTTTRGTLTSPMGNQDFQIDARQQLTVNLAKQTKGRNLAQDATKLFGASSNNLSRSSPSWSQIQSRAMH